jgi:hypothetical protein
MRRALAAPDEHARPLPLRVLPEPVRADLGLPDCGEHSTIVRMASTAVLKCNNCGGSMLRRL